jgi:hypothetical protein
MKPLLRKVMSPKSIMDKIFNETIKIEIKEKIVNITLI